MKKVSMLILMVSMMFLLSFSENSDGLKVFISVDMEGVAGVANWEDVSRNGKDYNLFRRIMTEEANAAIEGALAAGATDILVRDSHSTARNILPDLLNRNAKLLRDHGGGFMGMMEGFDKSFNAVIFIGYHAKAGTPNALLEHSFSRNVLDLSINGISLPEAGVNALIAGHFDVPVIFVSGDLAICEQAKTLFGEVETVPVKEGIGNAALSLHPEVAQEKIRDGVKKALVNLKKYEPYKLSPPYTMVIKFKQEELVNEKSNYPGVKRTGDWELTFESDDLMEVLNVSQKLRMR